MKLLKRDLIFLTVGAAVGATGMLIYIKDKFNSELQEEVDEVRDYYKDRFTKSPGGQNTEDLEKEAEKEFIDEDEVIEDEPEEIQDPRLSEKITQYNKIIDYTKENKISYGKTSEALKEREGSTPPFVISDTEMYDMRQEYDKVTLVYYAGDNTLADEDDFIIDDVEAIIGEDNLDSFGTECEDPDMVHIRNERLGSDYEVIRANSRYMDVVLGGGDE